MSDPAQPTTRENAWASLGYRLQLRLIRIIDIFSILAADLVVVVMGYGIIRLVSVLSAVNSNFFDTAKQISEGAFLLLYSILVIVDIFEFVRGEARERSN